MIYKGKLVGVFFQNCKEKLYKYVLNSSCLDKVKLYKTIFIIEYILAKNTCHVKIQTGLKSAVTILRVSAHSFSIGLGG